MEEKIMNMLEQLYTEVKDLKAGQADLQNDVKGLKQGQERIESKLDNTEAQNANRHVEMMNEIREMKKDLAAVEIITSKNWNEIAHLKAVK